MNKHWLPSVVLLLVLGALVGAFVLVTSDSPGRVIYTADERRALVVHRRMNLTQAPLLSNFYVGNQLLYYDFESADESGVSYLSVASTGATDGDYTAIPVTVSQVGATECRVRATLDARYEEVEGITTTVYDLDFEGAYKVGYTGSVPTTTLELIFPFPAGLDTLNQVYFLVDGEEPDGVQYSLGEITWWTEMASGEEKDVVVRYRARGVGGFRYAIDHNRRLESLDVEIAVQGLTGSEVPSAALPTTTVDGIEGEAGERFTWRYEALIADRDIQVTLPTQTGFVQRMERLQEPLRALSTASPLLVALFVVCLAAVHHLSSVRLPVQHYLLAGLGFFLFYPALMFLSAVVELPLAGAVACAAITALLLAFLGRAAGWRRTWRQTLLLCAVFLGLFSLGGMSPWRGLLITAGGIVLVGLFMLLMARYRPPQPAERDTTSQEEIEVEFELAEPLLTESAEPEAPSRYCPHCGGPLDEAFAFCPACGHDARLFRRCPACGSDHYVPPEAKLSHCPTCGEPLSAPAPAHETRA
jgi:hypothetical protein